MVFKDIGIIFLDAYQIYLVDFFVLCSVLDHLIDNTEKKGFT